MREPQERSELIRAVKKSGEAVSTVAARLGVPVSTAYRWMRDAEPEVAPTTRPTFVEVVAERERGERTTILVRVGVADMRLGAERLGGLVREKMLAELRSRALFVFVGKRGHTMKVLTWDGTGTIVIHKKLDAGRFELPRATSPGELHLRISDTMFDVIHKGVALTPCASRPRFH